MKKILLLAAFTAGLAFSDIMAQSDDYLKTDNEIIFYVNKAGSHGRQAVKLEVVTDDIVRVIAAPDDRIQPVSSLITSYKKSKNVSWTVGSTDLKWVITTRNLITEVDKRSGAVSFFDKDHKIIIAEKPGLGRSLQPVVAEGTHTYKISQAFHTSGTEGWYGLGQHQQGIMNWKGHQVTFFQNNTEVAIPFLLSSRNYGILWDNYSLTRAGCLNPLLPLSALQLYSKKGEPGWLTASYANNKMLPGEVEVERAESEINMPFLGDSKIKLPKEFRAESGIITWEGSISSPFSGSHQFQFTIGGTLKVWINHELVVDRWRKSWNPVIVTAPVSLTRDTKVPVKIQWIPEGESYLSAEWQRPLTADEKNTFAFSSDAGKQVDYYFVHGATMDSVIAGYRHITGKAPIVPKWALGFWQSRERYKTQEEVLSTVSEFRKRKIPLDNIVLDWNYWREPEWGSQEFDESRFADPDQMIDVLHKKYHTQLMISVWPKFYEGIAAYNDFDKKGWLYKRNIADRQRDWIGKGYVSTFYDAFNEHARTGFWNLIDQKLFKKGIDAWWMDASEPDILSNVSPAKRIEQMTPTALGTGTEYVNAYPLQNAKGIYEGQRSANKSQRVFLLTRSAFAGSQRYAAAVWSGDIGSTWNDMKNQVAAGANFSMSGLPYWTMDIGGFVVPERFEKPDAAALEEWRELMTRWSQFGSFVPLFRTHGQFPLREIYNTAPESHPAYQSFLYYDHLRYRLMPYLYSLAGAAYHTNYTIMRGLAMDFAADTAVLNIDDQYMFGPSLLINPVYQYQQTSRPVYLPKTAGWYDLYTGQWYAGGQKITAAAPYERMPVFVKAGSIIPVGPALQYTFEKPADTITLNIYSGANGSLNLYEDEGVNYNYEKGAYATIPVTYNDATKTVTIDSRNGSFSGMLQRRVFHINIIRSGKAKPLQFDGKADKTIAYTGEKIVLHF